MVEAPAASAQDASSFSSLKTGVAAVSEARDAGGRQTALDQVYLAPAGQASAEAEDIVSISGSPRFSAPTPTLSPYRPLAAAPAGVESGKSIAELEASAKDSALPFAERAAAVTAIAATAGDEARASLKSIGQADPEASALDYEVKRKALQALAGLGEVVSLPPVSRRHADEILKSLTDEKPEAAIFDYDDTLERNQRQASPKTAAGLKAVSDAGVGTMILTARSDRPEDMSGKTVLDSLSTLTPGQKAGLVIGSSRGARVLVFDKKGEAKLVASQPAWTEAERKAIAEAAAAVKARYGEARVARVGELTDFAFSLYLPVGTTPEDVEASARLLETELSQRGVKPAAISGRVARNPARPSFLVVSKYDKSLGVGLLLEDRDHYDRVRDIAQRLPSWLQGLAVKASALLPRKAVPGKKIVMVGDHFFGSRVEDLNMTKAAPEGLALAVGGTADPRVERVFVWPTQGFSATQEIMAALSAKAGGAVDRKVVGVAGYGALMAKAHTPAFPGMLLPVAAAFVAAGVVFYFAPRWLKGLPEKSLQKPS